MFKLFYKNQYVSGVQHNYYFESFFNDEQRVLPFPATQHFTVFHSVQKGAFSLPMLQELPHDNRLSSFFPEKYFA